MLINIQALSLREAQSNRLATIVLQLRKKFAACLIIAKEESYCLIVKDKVGY